MKTKWEGHFLKENLRIQFNVVFDYESNLGILDFPVPSGDEL